MFFIQKILVPKVLKCSLRGCIASFRIIFTSFHVVFAPFRVIFTSFCVVLLRMVTHHTATTFVLFFCHLHEIDINLINISEFLIYIINFVSPLKIYICIPFFNHFFSHFMVNSSNIFKKNRWGVRFLYRKYFSIGY